MEKKVAEDVKRKGVKKKEKEANAIIDLTDMDDIKVEDLLDDVHERGSKASEKRQREVKEEKDSSKRLHFIEPAAVGLATRLCEIFAHVPLAHVQQRCHELLGEREDFGSVEDAYERLTEEFLQYRTGGFFEEENGSSDSVATIPNLLNQNVKMEVGEEQQATVKVKTEGGMGDALQEVSIDPLLVGSVKSEVKKEEYVEAPQEISLQAQDGMNDRRVKEEMMAAEGGSKKAPLGALAFQR